MNWLRRSVRAKLMASFACVLVLTALIAFVGWQGSSQTNASLASVYGDGFQGEALLSRMINNSLNIRIDVLRHLGTGNDAEKTAIEQDIASREGEFLASMDALLEGDADGEERTTIAAMKESFASYTAPLDEALKLSRVGQRIAATVIATGPMADAFDAIQAGLASAEASNTEAANSNFAESRAATTRAGFILAGALLLTILIGLAIAFSISRSIVRGVVEVQGTLASLTDNCATWLQEGLERLRANDLTYGITPVTPVIAKMSTDEIGTTAHYANKLRDRLVGAIDAYNDARVGLTTTIDDVRRAAEMVARTSGELTAAAGQTGAAVQQVATTIQQVAAGASDQARAASDTSGSVSQLTSVIGQVGQGAADTSARIGEASETIQQLTAAISQASRASGEVGSASGTAASAAANGAAAVRDTVAGMSRIKDAVEVSSVRVTELGAKGDQIGAIVETINDIAEQTNLLALNAAIEAARAGEQGKGFAVVADEVRKLAERSGRATKEIAALIAEVQTGTVEAVKAMTVGAAEIEAGARLAVESRTALDEIAAAVAATRTAVGRIVTSVGAMSAASAGVVGAIDEIAGIAEDNNAAGATMSASASSVTRSIESIAAVSEENSASAEEVSAATEKMTIQAEEVVASAESLERMAAQLDALVARFRLESAPAPADTGRLAAAAAAAAAAAVLRRLDGAGPGRDLRPTPAHADGRAASGCLGNPIRGRRAASPIPGGRRARSPTRGRRAGSPIPGRRAGSPIPGRRAASPTPGRRAGGSRCHHRGRKAAGTRTARPMRGRSRSGRRTRGRRRPGRRTRGRWRRGRSTRGRCRRGRWRWSGRRPRPPVRRSPACLWRPRSRPHGYEWTLLSTSFRLAAGVAAEVWSLLREGDFRPRRCLLFNGRPAGASTP
jgi:methyl-accepting chemotaxis protein